MPYPTALTFYLEQPFPSFKYPLKLYHYSFLNNKNNWSKIVEIGVTIDDVAEIKGLSAHFNTRFLGC
jgi:hypothetical protein